MLSLATAPSTAFSTTCGTDLHDLTNASRPRALIARASSKRRCATHFSSVFSSPGLLDALEPKGSLSQLIKVRSTPVDRAPVPNGGGP
ncbi:hypothetical protein BU16DRAFT_522543 [Lophium mytilinum]|uniref:Uncharacterized protein n=1 Tax=Lophium mytilinum TaxID=390894 RepID=A0A6A6R9W4_9PEZI|nr:hypothetical protein BU16DRAFT_522543 [Lophium mytilinum]